MQLTTFRILESRDLNIIYCVVFQELGTFYGRVKCYYRVVVVHVYTILYTYVMLHHRTRYRNFKPFGILLNRQKLIRKSCKGKKFEIKILNLRTLHEHSDDDYYISPRYCCVIIIVMFCIQTNKYI